LVALIHLTRVSNPLVLSNYFLVDNDDYYEPLDIVSNLMEYSKFEKKKEKFSVAEGKVLQLNPFGIQASQNLKEVNPSFPSALFTIQPPVRIWGELDDIVLVGVFGSHLIVSNLTHHRNQMP